MDRRRFLKITGACAAALGVGGGGYLVMLELSQQASQDLDFTITDAVKDMITHDSTNRAQCYFWLFKEKNLPAEIPGPHIFAIEGATINITLTNKLDENHAFFVRGVVDSGPIAPGASKKVSFTAPAAGTYLYYDNLNEPVNRSMGLHGALCVMPKETKSGHKFTPYSNPTPAVQRLFDDFGAADHWPGLSWEEEDTATNTPPFRQYVWLVHQASSRLFAEVGSYPAGRDFPAAEFVKALLNDPFVPNGLNRKPDFHTVVGQSGHFAHDNPYICPMHRVGEPTIIRILNAGLTARSMHLHGNHFYLTGLNGKAQESLLWLDTYTVHPLDVLEVAVPFMRPPDIPNERGIGRADTPLTSIANPRIGGSKPHPVWPPTEELDMRWPKVGTKAGIYDIAVRMSPLCFPMHDHSETTQTAQGGNYNNGLISGLYVIGDRNTAGGVTTFPGAPKVHGPSKTGAAAGPDITI